jgi:hypothetical protein
MTEQEIANLWNGTPNVTMPEKIIAFAHLIATKQREIDAQICRNVRDSYSPTAGVDGPFEGADYCVDAIREQT